MRTGFGRIYHPLRRFPSRGSRARKPVIAAVATVAVAVLAGASIGLDQTVGHAAAAPRHQQQSSEMQPVSAFVPDDYDWNASAPTEPATAGTPLSLLAMTTATATGKVVTLQPEAFNALTLRAYQSAAASVAAQDPSCGLTWQMLAGIGRIESDNGRDVGAGGMTANGTISPPILGPALDGKNGFAAIRDGNGWAHATGPFQFIPSTWQTWGADGNGDGTKDANNIFDSSLGAAHYLCAGGRQLTQPTQLADAVFSYNHSRDYVQLVLQLIAGYAHESAATLLQQAELQRLPAGTTAPTAAPPKPTSPSWHAPALTGRAVDGGTVSLRPLAYAPATARSAAVHIVSEPSRGSAVALGSTVVFHAPTGFVGTETFRYSVAGHGTATASISVVPAPKTTTSPTAPKPSPTPSEPRPAGPSGSFTATVTPSGTSLDLSGTDSGVDTTTATITLTSSWTFAMKPTTAGGTATLVLPTPSASPSPSPSPTPDGDQGWDVSETWSAGGYDYVVIDAITVCDASRSCSAPAGPTSVGVDGGRFARATHDLTVGDASTTSADADATTALPLTVPSAKLTAKTY